MSDNTDAIRKCVHILNDTRDDVVAGASNFARIGKGLFNKTSKKQDSSGRMVSIIQKVLPFTSKSIPLIKLGAVAADTTQNQGDSAGQQSSNNGNNPTNNSNIIKLASLFKEIRDDIELGKKNALTSIDKLFEDIRNGLKAAPTDNVKYKILKPYKSQFEKLMANKQTNLIKSEAIQLMNINKIIEPVSLVCRAIINRINELEYYDNLHKVFTKQKDPETENDYLQILQGYQNQKDNYLDSQYKLLNKFDPPGPSDYQGNAQKNADKIIGKIEAAMNLTNS